MNAVWKWVQAKIGRLTTALGAFLQAIETFSIDAIKDPLEAWIGHKGVQGVVILLFVVSFARHQMVALKHPNLPPADDGK